tara:strand:+ start:187698 stop:188906 length:1209 start_codon:yes stop_codon:yes gene_type:complete
VSLRIVADENIPGVEQYFADLGEVHRIDGRSLQASDLRGTDVLLVRSVTTVDAQLLQFCSPQFVATATSGVDHIDRHYLYRNGIGFAHAPGSNANSVVEYVLGAIGAIDDHLETLLQGGSLGIVGYGIIGKALHARAAALGIPCKTYDPWLSPQDMPCNACLDDVLACNVVSLHAELTREQPWPSHHLLGREALAKLRPDGLLINASRGAVIDNQALLQALKAGAFPAVVLDVWEHEPVIDRDLLAKVRIGTAHIAGYSLDGKLRATEMLSRALRAWLDLDKQPDAPRASAISHSVTLDDAGSSASVIRNLLGTRYSVWEDDELLRKAINSASAETAATAFDQLRRNYRDRFEFAGSGVDGKAISDPEVRQLAIALGGRVAACDTVSSIATDGAPHNVVAKE